MSAVRDGSFIISVDTTLLMEALREVAPGALVTYADLSAIIGRDVVEEAYGQLKHARKKLRGAECIHFEPVPGSGLRRLTVEEVAASGGRHIKKVRSAARRGQEKMTLKEPDFKALSNELKVACNASQAMLGALEHVATIGNQKKIMKTIQDSGMLPTLAETLAATMKYFEK